MNGTIKSIFKSIISVLITAFLLALAAALALGALWLMVCCPYVFIVILLAIIVFMGRKEK